MIDTDRYEGHTEGKWECTDDADGGVELFSSHSKEFHQQWLADASLRHKTQQDKDGMGLRVDDGIITNIAHVLHPDDEGIGGGWFHEHNRLVPHEIWQKEQKANMRLIADAPLILEAYKEKCEEVKQLRKALEIEQQIVQAFYEYREDCCFDHCEAWMLEKGHRVMVNIGDDEQSEWKVEIE